MWNRNTVSDEIFIANFNQRNRTVTDEHLSDIFAKVGLQHGYDDVKAEFNPLNDFKLKWSRSFRWIRFNVSDYLDRAPDDVLYNLAEVIFSKIAGGDAEYGEAFMRYVDDPKIIKANQRDFLKRSRHLNDTSIGDYHDLNDCVNRLRDQGLIPNDMKCELRWDVSEGSKAAGCSVLQRVVWINKILDRKGVPENVLDYSVYHMMCHLMEGFGRNNGKGMFGKLLSKYPNGESAECWLNERGLYL